MSTIERCVIPVAKSPKEYQTYRISPDSSNKLAIAFDPLNDDVSLDLLHKCQNNG
jgi:hypothetical protein